MSVSCFLFFLYKDPVLARGVWLILQMESNGVFFVLSFNQEASENTFYTYINIHGIYFT